MYSEVYDRAKALFLPYYRFFPVLLQIMVA